MHRWVLPVAAFVVLAFLPVASSQAPPDPGAVVGAVCAVDPTVRDVLPVCAREEPAAPQAGAPAAAHQHGPADPQDAPAAAASLADEAAGAAQGTAEDPGSAPDQFAGFVATVVQFVKDLLGLPLVGLNLAATGLVDLGALLGSAVATAAGATVNAGAAALSATGDAFTVATDAVGGALATAASFVANLFVSMPAADAPTIAPPSAGSIPTALPVPDLLSGVRGTVGV